MNAPREATYMPICGLLSTWRGIPQQDVNINDSIEILSQVLFPHQKHSPYLIQVD